MADIMANETASKSAIFTPKVTIANKERRQGRLSIVLGIMAVIATSILTIWVLFFQSDQNITIDLNSVATTDDGRLELQGLSIKGKTSKGDPFTLNAETAAEDANNPEKVLLTTIDGVIETQTNGAIELVSQAGSMNQTENEIYLEGDVKITQSDRDLVFITQILTGNLETGSFVAPQAVEMQSPTSLLTGQAMQITNFGDVITLNGKSKAIIGE